MAVVYDLNMDVIALIAKATGYTLLALMVAQLYRKQSKKPPIIAIILVVLFGLFSFTINIPINDSFISLSILPLGVWILFFILKRKEGRWATYRSYAWLGFGANYLFLAIQLLAIPIHYFVYPEDKLETYFAVIEKAAVIPTHPSGSESCLDEKRLIEQIRSAKEEPFFSEEWYYETFVGSESGTKERFRYLLIGVGPKWSSGLHALTFIEKDGRGILVTSRKHQLYYRMEDSVFCR
ncbi:hypothetical protein NCCP2222_00370 [Sporosarcina sp. NCCP-2222]|uniref:hypothetical protein n=1 Tax=Sporosarcina sp. NCCP-2222 TaxID=2935073 RepID=UPI0020848DA1|nr:hypothetical protein [Sporosarcina sp. NCCP-2222]GKV54090.1 hypothetical protein NCCP2222_00370 [Sporosarcina sp. NCCP-2222]